MDEKLISDISYTNKDFQSIYPELLDLVKKLTNKWDPSLSNESDPGVLLLKLNALIADKNNYNIDKNILECFPSSVTQYGNARKIYDSLGYKMGWYKSATTQVGFQLKNTDDLTESEPVLIDLFTQLTDDTKEVSYVTLQGAVLSKKNPGNIVTVDAIEGTIQDYEINGETTLTLLNLDDNLRLYFNESRIAENGIYIKSNQDTNWFNWYAVDNITTYPTSSKVFEFGVLPNSDTCYIQFPSDITSLMSTFQLKYIISNGTNGNIKNNILNQFVNNISYGEGDSAIVVNDKIKITQQSGTTNGADIETLDQAYNNYKKTIGTFNTLVTNRDYRNAIYNAKMNNKYLISNIVVSDRTNDINCANKMQSWGLEGTSENSITLRYFDENGHSDKAVDTFDIMLYVLKDIDNLNTLSNYNQSFELDGSDETKTNISNYIDSLKSIQHNLLTYPDLLELTTHETDYGEQYKIPAIETLYTIFLNLYSLNGQFITYNKVTRETKAEIENNIKLALYNKYNSRNLNFGEAIDYFELVETIKNSDARIKDVNLNLPNLTTKVLASDSNGLTTTLTEDIPIIGTGSKLLGKNSADTWSYILKGSIINGATLTESRSYQNDQVLIDGDFLKAGSIVTNGSVLNKVTIDLSKRNLKLRDLTYDDKVDLIARMVLAGNIQLLSFDNFKYEFGQDDLTIIQSTNNEAKIKSISTNLDLTISSTPTILSENQVVQFSTPNYITATTYSSWVKYLYITSKTTSPQPNTLYKLQPGEYIVFTYKDSSGVQQKTTIKENTYIMTNVGDLVRNSESTLYSSDYIDVKQKNQQTLIAGTKCYTILKSGTLSLEPQASYMLQENEYLIYTNISTDELVLLGSGTLLENQTDALIEFNTQAEIDLSLIESGNYSSIDWLTLSSDLTITEMSIVTAGAGAIISSNSSISINSESQLFNNCDITIKTSEELILHCSDETPYLTQTKLNLNSTQASPQLLHSGETIEFTFIDGNTKTITSDNTNNKYLVFNQPLLISGGKNIDMAVLLDAGYEYTLEAHTYLKTAVGFELNNVELDTYGYIEKANVGNAISVSRVDNYLQFVGSEWAGKHIQLNFKFPYQMVVSAGKNYDRAWILPIVSSNSGIKYVAYDANYLPTSLFNYSTSWNELDTDIPSGAVTLGCLPTEREGKLVISFPDNFGEMDTLFIGNIYKAIGYNTDEINSIESNMSYFDSSYNMYIPYRPSANVIGFTPMDAIAAVKYRLSKYLNSRAWLTFSGSTLDDMSFNWTYDVNQLNKLLYPMLPNSFFDSKHIANKFTLSKIDFENSTISLNPYYLA